MTGKKRPKKELLKQPHSDFYTNLLIIKGRALNIWSETGIKEAKKFVDHLRHIIWGIRANLMG